MVDNQLKKEIIQCLKGIKGGGTFCSQGSRDFIFPQLSIEGLGELAYPINEIQARALISVAHKAPFGKGHETLIDPTVRSAWEINDSQLIFEGTGWSDMIKGILKGVKKDLGIKEYDVEAQLYKLLIYEKGDFFLTHKDSEKEANMFGTLIVALPSNHTGAELLVRFEGEEKTIDFSADSRQGKLAFGAFYADCDHEVKPLTEGFRVVLVYNLIQKVSDHKIALQSFKKHIESLSTSFRKVIPVLAVQKDPLIIYLGHQYTPSNFKLDNLKLNDRAKSRALLQAAKDAGLYANLCLITSYKIGSPKYYDDYDCDEIDEVFDYGISLEKWADGGYPELRKFDLNDEDIIAPFSTESEEPIEVENSGYMGNYGPDITYWYHYGAVAVWSKEQHKNILFHSSNDFKIKWLSFYNTNRNSLEDNDNDIAKYLVQILSVEEIGNGKNDFGPVIDWLILENDKNQLQDLGYQLLERYFTEIKAEKWLELGQFYGVDVINDFVHNINNWDQKRTKQLINILHEFTQAHQFEDFVKHQLMVLPKYYYTMMESLKSDEFPIKAKSLHSILALENSFPQSTEWVATMSNLLSRCNLHEYLIEVWANTILETKLRTPLLKEIYNETCRRVKFRVANQPEPPRDWSRAIPQNTSQSNSWKILEAFMQSPTEQVFDYR
ncbi:MAG: 2OG-Fe(II) oxygenase, partial [Saprospiraceae bacterium]